MLIKSTKSTPIGLGASRTSKATTHPLDDEMEVCCTPLIRLNVHTEPTIGTGDRRFP